MKRLGAVVHVIVATCLILVLIFSGSRAAAASLLGVQVLPYGSGAQVSITFGDSVPLGWTVAGDGTQQILVVLPQTHGTQNSVAGVNNVVGVTTTARDSSLVVLIQLTAAQHLRYSESNKSISVYFPGATPSATVPKMASTNKIGGDQVSPTSDTLVVRLRYADATEVAGVLASTGADVPANDDVLTGSMFSLPTQTGGFSYQPQSLPVQQPAGATAGRRIDDHIAIDRRLNAIILTGTKNELAKMAALVGALDSPVPSVMLECEVVELSDQGQKDVGIDYTDSQGGPIAAGSAAIGSLNGTGSGGPPVFAANLMAKIFATIANGNGKVLAFPRVLAQSGTPAQILTGDAIPIISTTVFPGPPVTTQTSTSYITVGVNLHIIARSSGDGTVVTRIFTEVSSVTNEVATPQGNVPQISLRQASTTATVRDGQSFVIGGLLEDQEFEQLSRVPLISSIPIIGSLFKVEHGTSARSNLFVIVTPRVVAPLDAITPPAGLPTPQVPGPH